MRIGVITIDDPIDKKSWSGILSKVYNGLEQKYGKSNVISIGPLFSFGLNRLLAFFNFIILKLFGFRYNYSHSLVLSFFYSTIVNWRFKNLDVNIVFAIGSTNAFAFFRNKREIPIILLTDATFASLNNYYLKNVARLSIIESNFIEKRALMKCSHVVFSSRWSEIEANIYYDLQRFCRSSVIKFGSNLNNSFLRNFEESVSSSFNILFVGVDWERKGGELLLRSYENLRNKGYQVNLTIVGCVPPGNYDKSIKVHKFLDKNNIEDLSTLENLFRQSDIFVLPTRAECSAIVYSEAASFSLPIISTKTGGVQCYVEDGLTGYLVELSDNEDAITTKIMTLIDNKGLYKSFSYKSYIKYERELNWSNFFVELDNIFKSYKKK